jgi:hypothetical protein
MPVGVRIRGNRSYAAAAAWFLPVTHPEPSTSGALRSLGRCADVHSAETIVSVCRVGLKVMDGGGFAASLNEFSKEWAIYFPDVVSSKSKKALTKI